MPISELIYQPLKGAAGNSRPPISRSMLDTAGRAYQRRPRAANHSSLGFGVQISLCAELSCAPHSPSSKEGLQVAHAHPVLHAHVGCSRGTSRTSSGGRVKSSGGSSGAWSSRGSTSKRPFPGAQPCWTQSCGRQAEFKGILTISHPHSLLQGLLSSWVFVPTGGPYPFVVKAFLELPTLLLQPIKSRITEMHHHAWLPIFHPKEGPLLLLPPALLRIPMLCPGFPILSGLGTHL